MRIPFIGQGAVGRSEYVNSERLINLYSQNDPTGKATLALYNCPGLKRKRVLTGGGGRNLLSYDDVLYAVAGDRFYSLDTHYTPTQAGTLDTDEGFVSSATNGLVVLIVDGDNGYTYTISSGAFAKITDADFPDHPIVCGVLDNTFIVIDRGTQRLYTSADGTTWEAADFASAETAPDDLVGLIVDHQELVLFGDDSTEIWYNSGGTFTFSRRTAIENGCGAKGSPAKIDNSVLWLDNKNIIRALRGYTDTRVSTHAIEYRIGLHTKAEIRDATAFAYSQEGHSFYQFTIGDETFVFDIANNRWHERGYLVASTGELTRHRAECHAIFNRRNVVIDHEDGRIYEYDLDTFTDDGDYIQAVWAYRHLDAEGRRVRYNRLEIEVETGVGPLSGVGSVPKIETQWSNDGGRTWSPWYSRDIGGVGLYKTVASWSGLGASKDRVFQSRITHPVKRVIANANLDVTPLGL